MGKDDGIGVVHRTMKFLVKYLSTRDTKLRRLVADVTRNLISEKLETVQSLYLVDSQIDGNYDIISALMGQFFVEQDAVIRYILSDAILNIASFGTHKDITSVSVQISVFSTCLTCRAPSLKWHLE